MRKFNFLEALKSLLNSTSFQDLLEAGLLKLLKMQALGGFRGWLLRLVVKEFSEEIVVVLADTTEYIIVTKKAKGTINETDRDKATDTLNDIMRN